MFKVTFLIDNCDREYYERDRQWLMQDAIDYGYTEDEFVFTIEEDQCGYSLITISEPDVSVEFDDDWIEFSGGHTLNGYVIYFNNTATGDIRVKYTRQGA